MLISRSFQVGLAREQDGECRIFAIRALRQPDRNSARMCNLASWALVLESLAARRALDKQTGRVWFTLEAYPYTGGNEPTTTNAVLSILVLTAGALFAVATGSG